MKLEINDLEFAYKTNKPLFSGLEFNATSGQILAILGPNGSGKTTLLRLIMGMLKVDKGQILLDGEDVYKISPTSFWKLIGYVPQQRMAQSSFTALESVLLGRSGQKGIFSTPDKADFEIARANMSELGILHLENQPCDTLSGGEFQLVLIARALCSNPKLLILDEPESGLDFKNQLVVLDTLERLKAKGIGCIFNTHYPNHALKIADNSLILDGKSGIFGVTKEILNEKVIEQTFGVSVAINRIETEGGFVENITPIKIC